jgi:hypothetical protein
MTTPEIAGLPSSTSSGKAVSLPLRPLWRFGSRGAGRQLPAT